MKLKSLIDPKKKALAQEALRKRNPDLLLQGRKARLHPGPAEPDEIVKIKAEPLDPKVRMGLDKRLMEALWTGNSDLAKAIISNGVDANATDNGGNTLLMIAARHCDSTVVEMLIQRGADVNTRNCEGHSALDWACEKGRVENEAVLRRYGATW